MTLILPENKIVTPRQIVKMADLFPEIGSLKRFAQGFNTSGDVVTQTLDGRDLNEIWAEFQAALRMQNEFRQPLINLLTFNVSAPMEDVPNISEAEEFEEASEFGVPKSVKAHGYFSRGYDFKWYDLAVRFTWQFLAEASAAQVDSLNNIALEADNRLVFKLVLKAIFNNTQRSTDIRGTAYNVFPFYNGDSEVPPAFKTATFTTGHDHYIISGSTTVDAGDLDTMEAHLKEHGYGATFGANLFLLVNSAQVPTMRTFRVATGSSYDFIPASGNPPFLSPVLTGIVGGQPNNDYNGLYVVGRYGNWLVIEDDFIPAGYMLGFATGGMLSAGNPVGIREHQNAGLRGLRLVKGRTPDYPLIDSYYQRGMGTGVRYRGAGVVTQLKTPGSYDIPAAYA